MVTLVWSSEALFRSFQRRSGQCQVIKGQIFKFINVACRVGLRPERTIFRSGGQDVHGVLASFWVGTAFSNTYFVLRLRHS